MEMNDTKLDELNEADVREEVIAPFLRELGYRSGTTHNIIREQSLRYPRRFLGRKKKSDPLLRGKADYICEAGGKVRWVIEAKAASEKLGIDVVEQAYTYAQHPEVRAVYFCLTNGRDFIVHRTDRAPEAKPVLSVSLDADGRTSLKNLLSPSSILRDHPDTQLDLSPPLAPGLRSIAQIASGRVTIRHVEPETTHMEGLIHSIVAGAVERNDGGTLIAYLDLLPPFQSMHDFARRFGLDRMELASASTSLSTNADTPTIFQASCEMHIPAGEKVFNLQTGSFLECPVPLKGLAQTRAEVALTDKQLHGSWSQSIKFSLPGLPDMGIDARGDFDARIS